MGLETRWTSPALNTRWGNGTGHALGDWLHQTLTVPMERAAPMERAVPMERTDPMGRAARFWARLHSVIFCCHRWSLFADYDVSHLPVCFHVLLTRVNERGAFGVGHPVGFD